MSDDILLVPRTDVIGECVIGIQVCDEMITILEQLIQDAAPLGASTRFYDDKIMHFCGMRAGYMRVTEWMREWGKSDE